MSCNKQEANSPTCFKCDIKECINSSGNFLSISLRIAETQGYYVLRRSGDAMTGSEPTKKIRCHKGITIICV
jgi:hypothetical protein